MGLFKKAAKGTAVEATEWPNINELIWIRLPCCETAVHPSRVEDIDDNQLVVARPEKPHTEPVPAPSTDSTFIIGWTEGVNSKQSRVKLVSAHEGSVPVWKLSQESKPEAMQRRNFVRAEWVAPVTVHLPMGDVEGTILDISEGGVRCQIPAANEPRSPFFQIAFELNKEHLVLECEVCWWGTPANGTVTIGLQFIDQSQALTDKLRSFAYNQQLKQRQEDSN